MVLRSQSLWAGASDLHLDQKPAQQLPLQTLLPVG